jgi:hypothetical protein
VDEGEGIAYAGRFVIDVSDVTQPSLIATMPLSAIFGIGSSDGSDGVVYVPSLIQGVHIYRAFTPSPTPVVPTVGGLSWLLGLAGWLVIRKRSSRWKSRGLPVAG